METLFIKLISALQTVQTLYGKYILGAIIGNLGYISKRLTDKNFRFQAIDITIHAVASVSMMLVIEELPINKDIVVPITWGACLFTSHIIKWVGSPKTEQTVSDIANNTINKLR